MAGHDWHRDVESVCQRVGATGWRGASGSDRTDSKLDSGRRDELKVGALNTYAFCREVDLPPGPIGRLHLGVIKCPSNIHESHARHTARQHRQRPPVGGPDHLCTRIAIANLVEPTHQSTVGPFKTHDVPGTIERRRFLADRDDPANGGCHAPQHSIGVPAQPDAPAETRDRKTDGGDDADTAARGRHVGFPDPIHRLCSVGLTTANAPRAPVLSGASAPFAG